MQKHTEPIQNHTTNNPDCVGSIAPSATTNVKRNKLIVIDKTFNVRRQHSANRSICWDFIIRTRHRRRRHRAWCPKKTRWFVCGVPHHFPYTLESVVSTQNAARNEIGVARMSNVVVVTLFIYFLCVLPNVLSPSHSFPCAAHISCRTSHYVSELQTTLHTKRTAYTMRVYVHSVCVRLLVCCLLLR